MDHPLPLFAAEPLAGITLALALAAVLYSEYRIGRRNRPAPGTPDLDSRSGLLVAGALTLCYAGGPALGLLVPATVITGHRTAVFATGIAIGVLGQGFRLHAVRTLADWFSFAIYTRRDQPVVDTGPYRLIRHPSYTGALGCALGFELACTNWLAPALVGFLALAYVVRIPVEERAMVAGLGEAYRRYMTRTKRLIPYIL